MSDSPEQVERPTYAAGNRILSFIGYAIAILGAAFLLLDRRSKWSTGQSYVILESAQIPLLMISGGMIILGAAAFLIFKWIPQQTHEVWPEMDQETTKSSIVMNEVILSLGTMLIPSGLLSGAILYNQDIGNIAAALAVCWTAVGLGALMFLWGIGRKGLLHRILASTLSTQESVESDETIENDEAWNEALEAEPPVALQQDPRLAIVLPVLDDLLSKIPDEDLEKFKGSEAATLYLELLDSLGE